MTRTRVGVVGVGVVGRQHARVLAEIPEAELVGVHDLDPARGAEVAAAHGGTSHASLDALLQAVEAVVVAVPTVSHHAVAAAALRAGRHVLVEKPVTDRLEDADELVRLAEEGQRVFHVGHVERFNPAVDSLRRHAGPARFVEAHRLASFAPRSLDVDVVLDLMIHDLDIVLALDGSEPVQVDAVGVSVLTGQVDIASVRLRFASGLVANLTASRVSAERVRKFRVFAPRTYISADLLSGAARVHRLAGGPGGPRIEVTAEDGSATHEPLRRQHEAFVRSVRGEPGPGVTGREGRRALALARTILERIAEHNRGLGPAGPPGGTR